MLAMLFLVLMATLAIGFYAQTIMSGQVAKNDRALSQADAAADGGMQFIRYQLGAMTIPPGTPQSSLLDAAATQLGLQLNGTPNMNGHTVQNTNGTIYIPSAGGWTTFDNDTGAKFRAAIRQFGTTLVVTVTGDGLTATLKKGIQLQYQQAQVAGAIFNYGIATKGALSMSNTVNVTGATDPTKGSVLIASGSSQPLNVTGPGSSFSGDLSYTNASGVNNYGTLDIAGYNSSSPKFDQHVHAGVTPPLFPTVDTSVFLPYCTTTYPSLSGAPSQTLVNTILQANGNYNFSNNTVVQGVLYIKTPNRVSFSGPTTIQGAIVVENNPQGTDATNLLSFTNKVTIQGMNTLPATSQFPPGERALTGSVLLAPNFSVTVTNNMGAVAGSMIAGKFTFTNNFAADITGSIVQLDDTPMQFTNTANVTIASVGTSYFPAGVTFGTKYVPLPGTYLEVRPQ